MRLRNLESRSGRRPADVWVLLSDTDNFLSRARLKPRFENRVREWRQRLQENHGDPDVVRAVHGEIVAVRRALREEGWELRLGSLDIVLKGFRSDDSVAWGFARMVILLVADGRIFYAVGEANHLTLEKELRLRLDTMRVAGNMAVHYLWYRVSSGVIELAGADSETRQSYDKLGLIVEERKSDLVRALRRLK